MMKNLSLMRNAWPFQIFLFQMKRFVCLYDPFKPEQRCIGVIMSVMCLFDNSGLLQFCKLNSCCATANAAPSHCLRPIMFTGKAVSFCGLNLSMLAQSYFASIFAKLKVFSRNSRKPTSDNITILSVVLQVIIKWWFSIIQKKGVTFEKYVSHLSKLQWKMFAPKKVVFWLEESLWLAFGLTSQRAHSR